MAIDSTQPTTAGGSPAVDAMQAHLARLQQEVEQAAAQLASLAAQQQHAEAASLQAARDALASERAALEKARESLARHFRSLRRRKAELRSRLAAALAHVKHKEHRALEAIERRIAKLDAAEAALRRRSRRQDARRAKLHRYRELLTQRLQHVARESAALESANERARLVLDQRQSLLELQALLHDAEQRMIRRWGIGRGVGWIVGLLAALVLTIALSSMSASAFATRTFAATGAVQIPLTENVGSTNWVAAQRDVMLTEPVLQQAVAWMKQTGYPGVTDLATLRSTIDHGLSLSNPLPGVLEAELHGPDAASLKPALDALLRAYAARATVQAAAPSATPARIINPVTLHTAPVADTTAKVFTVTFTITAALAAGLFAAFTFALIRTKKPDADILDHTIATADEPWHAFTTGLTDLPPTSQSK